MSKNGLNLGLTSYVEHTGGGCKAIVVHIPGACIFITDDDSGIDFESASEVWVGFYEGGFGEGEQGLEMLSFPSTVEVNAFFRSGKWIEKAIDLGILRAVNEGEEPEKGDLYAVDGVLVESETWKDSAAYDWEQHHKHFRASKKEEQIEMASLAGINAAHDYVRHHPDTAEVDQAWLVFWGQDEAKEDGWAWDQYKQAFFESFENELDDIRDIL